jgi:hypothetical protein
VWRSTHVADGGAGLVDRPEFIAEAPQFRGHRLSVRQGSRRAPGQQPDVRETDLRQHGAEPVLPRSQRGRQQFGGAVAIHGAVVADQGQHIRWPGGRHQADPGRAQPAQSPAQLSPGQWLSLPAGQAPQQDRYQTGVRVDVGERLPHVPSMGNRLGGGALGAPDSHARDAADLTHKIHSVISLSATAFTALNVWSRPWQGAVNIAEQPGVARGSHGGGDGRL